MAADTEAATLARTIVLRVPYLFRAEGGGLPPWHVLSHLQHHTTHYTQPVR